MQLEEKISKICPISYWITTSFDS